MNAVLNSRDRVRRALRREQPDRVPRFDHFWQDAARALRSQAGAPPGADLNDLFDFDIRALSFDWTARLPRTVLREDEVSRVYRDANGATIREFKNSQTTGEHIDFAVKDPDVWRQSFRARYAFDRTRVDWEASLRAYRRWREEGRYIVLSCREPFEAAWPLVGPVAHMLGYAEEPEWIQDIYEVQTKQVEDAWVAFREAGIEFDGAWFWGDIAYKNTSMVSPRQYVELLMPFHKRLCGLVHGSGGETIHHSDGNLKGLIPKLIDAGFDCLQPLEVKAGMDVRELKSEYGARLSFMGNIDARLFQANDGEGLEREIREKITAAKESGGYVYHSDHSVPPGVTLDTYRHALSCVDKYGRYD
ncbi:MAG: hypothetical protein M5U26_12785 [Planctomycetota bacterium]|nr:hypothetical protein [Planctomycetota bacterium]